MTQQETEMFIMQKGSYFPQTQVPYLQEMLSKKENISFDDLWSVPLKNPTTALLLSIAGGTLGIDRFWLRQPVSALLKLMLTICYLVFYVVGSNYRNVGRYGGSVHLVYNRHHKCFPQSTSPELQYVSYLFNTLIIWINKK